MRKYYQRVKFIYIMWKNYRVKDRISQWAGRGEVNGKIGEYHNGRGEVNGKAGEHHNGLAEVKLMVR